MQLDGYQCLQLQRNGAVLEVRLHRPQVLNALNLQMMRELCAVAEAMDADPALKVMLLTGDERAFAAGADIAEMAENSAADMLGQDPFAGWDRFAAARKPRIAAVAGYALGGGCELAMMCDFILAADSARFGQPEIKLGVLPGLGGTQRLTRLVGRSKAMELCLSGRLMDASEAERCGLVARVIPAASLLDEARASAQLIAGWSLPALRAVRDAVNAALETPLAEGLRAERRQFYAMFAFADQKEGMRAFLAERPPQFTDC